MDIDGDGSKEILVTDLVNETLESFVLKKKGDTYQEVAGGIRYYLVVLPDWMGKPMLVGQYQGIDTPFQGRIVILRWDGKGFVEGEKLPQDTDILPLSSGLPGLSSARFGKEWRLIYTDENSNLRVLDAGGKSQYKSSGRYGSSPDLFEWGPIIQLEGHRKWYHLRKRGTRGRRRGGGPPGPDSGGQAEPAEHGVVHASGSPPMERGGIRGEGGHARAAAATSRGPISSPRDDFEKGGRIVASDDRAIRIGIQGSNQPVAFIPGGIARAAYPAHGKTLTRCRGDGIQVEKKQGFFHGGSGMIMVLRAQQE